MLIIEGGDCVGKTTLQKAVLHNLWDAGMIHVPMHLSRLPESWDHYQNYMAIACINSVWDRFHISELVYRGFDERHTNMSQIKWRMLEAHLTMIGAFRCVVYSSNSCLGERWKVSQKEELYSIERSLQVNTVFRNICQNHPIITLRGFDYTPVVDCWIDTSPAGLDTVKIEPFADRLTTLYIRHLEAYRETLGND